MNFNNFFRWFRSDVRDPLIDKIVAWIKNEIQTKFHEYREDLFKGHVTDWLRAFWSKQPWFVRFHRKAIMTEVRKRIIKLFGELL